MFVCMFFFFFNQNAAYEMRSSDWSSDVCSSDLASGLPRIVGDVAVAVDHGFGRKRLKEMLDRRCHRIDVARCAGYSLRQHASVEEIGRASCRERECKYV